MNRVKEVERINAKDLATQLRADTVGNAGKWDDDRSWHSQYKHSAYVYVGGLPYDLSEGDLIVIFSQFGEIVDVHMPRDKDTGKPKGFAFICYEDRAAPSLPWTTSTVPRSWAGRCAAITANLSRRSRRKM